MTKRLERMHINPLNRNTSNRNATILQSASNVININRRNRTSIYDDIFKTFISGFGSTARKNRGAMS